MPVTDLHIAATVGLADLTVVNHDEGCDPIAHFTGRTTRGMEDT